VTGSGTSTRTHTRQNPTRMGRGFTRPVTIPKCGTARINKIASARIRFFLQQIATRIVIRGLEYVQKHPSYDFPMLFKFGHVFHQKYLQLR
jgi:hypothetical protein